MKRQLLSLTAAALASAALIAACDTGSRFDANSLAPIIGERNAGVLAAGGRAFNAASLSQKDEDAIGQSVAIAITNQYPLVRNDNLQRYVNLVGLTVASVSPAAGGNWIFGVIESPEINAFSGPNGYVFVTHGAILQMKDEAELAGVLGHEIAHVSNHDGLNQIKANEERGALTQFMQAADSRTAQLAVFADNGLNVITKQGYSQPQEFAADQAGTRLISAAGYNPRSYLNFLQRIQSLNVSNSGKIMSTHPGIGERVARVSQQLQSLPPTGATLADRFTSNAISLH